MKDYVLFEGGKFDLGFSEVIKVDIIKASSLNNLRKSLHKENNLIVVEGGGDDINRFCVENKKVDILLSPEKNKKKEFSHFRDSGLNHILCKLAAENNVAIGFSFSDILNCKDSFERIKLLSTMIQNIKLCKKYKTKIVFASFAKNKFEMRNASDLKSFAKVLGM